MTAALSTPPSSRPSAKNRTRVISVIGEKHVGARGAAARGPHWAFRSLEGKTASANTVHENWNRYYDPSTGRYLSPEPLLQDPWSVSAYALRGFQLPPYAYALNNPIGFVDRDGLGPDKPGRPGKGPGAGGAANTDFERGFTPTNLKECLELALRGLKELEDQYNSEFNRRLDELNELANDPDCPIDIMAELKKLEDDMNIKQKGLRAKAKFARRNCEAAFPPDGASTPPKNK